MGTKLTKRHATRDALQREERNERALQLRLAGLGYREIAAQMKTEGYRIGKSVVGKVVNARLAELAEKESELADGIREIEIRRLDDQLAALWPLAMGIPENDPLGREPREPNLSAHDRVLRIAERRAKLLGLDMPQRISATTPDGKEAAPIVVRHDLSALSDEDLGVLERLVAKATPEQADAADDSAGAPTLH